MIESVYAWQCKVEGGQKGRDFVERKDRVNQSLWGQEYTWRISEDVEDVVM